MPSRSALENWRTLGSGRPRHDTSAIIKPQCISVIRSESDVNTRLACSIKKKTRALFGRLELDCWSEQSQHAAYSSTGNLHLN